MTAISRSKKMYTKSPQLARDEETGKMVIKRKVPEAAKDTTKGLTGVALKHAKEALALKQKHEKEELEMNQKFETETSET